MTTEALAPCAPPPPAPSLPSPPSSSAPPLLRVDGLSVHFDTPRGPLSILAEVGCTLAPGEILGVVGESGAGKSMLGKAIAGLLDPGGHLGAGSIWLRGERIDTLGAEDRRRLRGKHIGMVFQDPMTSLNPVLTIGRHLEETIRTHLPLTPSQARERALALLQAVGIAQAEARLRQYPHQLSGGMRQRVAIALALCADPALLIADEPTTALDVIVQAQVIEVLRRLCRERGTALMLVSHDMGVIAGVADRVMVMRAGRVVESGPVAEVLEHPRAPYTRALVAAIPPLDRRLRRLPTPDDAVPPAPLAVAAQPAQAAQPLPTVHMPAGAAPLLQVSGLSRRFDLSAPWLLRTLAREPRRVLQAAREVSFAIPRGTTFGLVGESGSGKSTVARMIAGLLRPSAGSVTLDGIDPWSGTQAAAALLGRFQMVFQDPYASLNPRWRVGRIVAEPLLALRARDAALDAGAIRERVAQALQRVRLPADAARRYPHQFSGGQRQRIALARALVSRPDFLICDEPTSSLDVSVQAQVLNLMRDLQDELGLTYLLISHNLAVIRQMCDQVGVMQAGELVECGPAGTVLDTPRHPYTRRLLAAVPDLGHGRRPLAARA
ncbi:dipeptide ABC transporter ATP-binding protein [Cupriavidus sp. USMAA2-4]|uniref:dipeptide ABC transporter ATP-binding protein n=1 Tax=Cupriavidus sp. USMAA2-4 TaxID=876364 RepID=UPI000A016E8D|nr:ABC transporter ATP-binding protein [Cupriavidus sp. USMAA2-4]